MLLFAYPRTGKKFTTPKSVNITVPKDVSYFVKSFHSSEINEACVGFYYTYTITWWCVSQAVATCDIPNSDTFYISTFFSRRIAVLNENNLG